jgi:inositol transport system permease protein
MGLGAELDGIAAATVGGCSHSGGIGQVSGIIAGILILGVINNGLLVLGISMYIQQIVKGAIIVGAVILDMRKTARGH